MATHPDQQISDPIFLYEGPKLANEMYYAMEHAFDGDFTKVFVEFKAMEGEEGSQRIRVRIQGLQYSHYGISGLAFAGYVLLSEVDLPFDARFASGWWNLGEGSVRLSDMPLPINSGYS